MCTTETVREVGMMWCPVFRLNWDQNEGMSVDMKCVCVYGERRCAIAIARSLDETVLHTSGQHTADFFYLFRQSFMSQSIEYSPKRLRSHSDD